MDNKYDAIIKDVMAAFKCADKGEYHSRLNQMMNRTYAYQASFMPPCPESVRPPERRKFTKENPAPILDDYWSTHDEYTGYLGATRQD